MSANDLKLEKLTIFSKIKGIHKKLANTTDPTKHNEYIDYQILCKKYVENFGNSAKNSNIFAFYDKTKLPKKSTMAKIKDAFVMNDYNDNVKADINELVSLRKKIVGLPSAKQGKSKYLPRYVYVYERIRNVLEDDYKSYNKLIDFYTFCKGFVINDTIIMPLKNLRDYITSKPIVDRKKYADRYTSMYNEVSDIIESDKDRYKKYIDLFDFLNPKSKQTSLDFKEAEKVNGEMVTIDIGNMAMMSSTDSLILDIRNLLDKYLKNKDINF